MLISNGSSAKDFMLQALDMFLESRVGVMRRLIEKELDSSAPASKDTAIEVLSEALRLLQVAFLRHWLDIQVYT